MAATQARGLRFLPTDAPRLPMAACTMPAACACTYRHHADRRARRRRASDLGIGGRYGGTERRARRGRRTQDGA